MNSTSLLDSDKINELKEILEDGFLDLFVEFRSGSNDIISNLMAEYENGNTEEMMQLAHILKGSAGNLGLNSLYQLMIDLEYSIREENNAEIAVLVKEVESVYFETLKVCIENGYLKG